VISNAEPNPIPFAPMTKKERGRRAYQLLRAVREAIAALRAQCPSEERVKMTVNEVCRQTARMLGLSPGPAPSDAASQEELVKTAGKMAGALRAYNWADDDIAATDASTTAQAPHVGESGAAQGFDVAGKLILPHASAEGWASELCTSVAKGDAKLELTVKVGKYLLHPTPLLILDDLTQMCGRAIYSSHVNELSTYVSNLRSLMKAPTDDSKWPSPDPEDSLEEVLRLKDTSELPPPPQVPLFSERRPYDMGVSWGERVVIEGFTSLAHDSQRDLGTDYSNTGLGYSGSYGGLGNRARRRRDLPGACTPPPTQPTPETQSPLTSPRTPGSSELRQASSTLWL
jgi:hypothetical protein